MNVGGDFRPSPSGKLTVLKSTNNPLLDIAACQCYNVLGVFNVYFSCQICKYLVTKDNRASSYIFLIYYLSAVYLSIFPETGIFSKNTLMN